VQVYLFNDGCQAGPYTEEELRGLILAGTIPEDILARIKGDSAWRQLSTIFEQLEEEAVSSRAFPVSSDSPATNGPSGVGGWLFFFVLF
jgi:hypothetical protein